MPWLLARPPPGNSPASGAPTISGTAQADETLTADTSGIADEDGLDDDAFSYQWVANDGTADTDIEGATVEEAGSGTANGSARLSTRSSRRIAGEHVRVLAVDNDPQALRYADSGGDPNVCRGNGGTKFHYPIADERHPDASVSEQTSTM